MNHTKAATLEIGTAIAAVTLALLVTAALVSMMPIVQTAHASCITSPKGDQACSGGSPITGANSFSTSHGVGATGANAESGPSGSLSQHVITPLPPSPPILDQSSSHNFQGLGNCATSNGHTVCSGH